MEKVYSIKVVLTVTLVALIVGAVVGAAFLSETDTRSNEYHIARWSAMQGDPEFRALGPEDRIEVILVEIRDGADPKPAWPVVSEMLTNAYADIYANGFVDCQDECEQTIDQIHMVQALMENEGR